ncbi:MAG: hypothetical protein EBR86_11350 [Planctomycetia bacterium]|nr:hypothetical protein [Planctomycetia bacterium]
MIATSVVEGLSVGFDPVGSGWVVAAVTAALAAILFLFAPDPTRLRPQRRWILIGVRLAAFLALLACLLRPTLVAVRKARQQGTVIVLADASESMTVADGAGGRTRWQEMTAALGAARKAARTLVANGDFDIALWRFDRGATPVAGTADDPFPLGEWQRQATAEESALGAALDDVVRATAGRTVAGVIVLSDGAQHAYPPRDVPPQTVARRIGDAAVPLWSVAFGQQRGGGQGRDAAVVSLSAAETVYLKNSLEVSGRVRLEGFGERDIPVKLLAETDTGALEEVSRVLVRASARGGDEPVRLSWTPRSVGEKKLVLAVEPQDGEVVVTNNEMTTFVDVIDGGLRVLYLEGTPRVEQRYLRRVLAASPDIQVAFESIDSTAPGRRRWPVDLSTALATDANVILIGDLDSSALRPEDLRVIQSRVGAGAGIGFLGGFHAFEAGGWGGTVLAPLLPFEPDQLARQPFDQPVRAGLHLPGPIRMLPDPRFGSVSILRQAEGPQDSLAVWQRLPPLDGANVLGRLTPTAKPLALTADGRPLLVAREFGEGRVLAFAADSTWRWAMQGAAEQHRRFWRQLVLWLARKEDNAADTAWVRLAQRRLSPGATLSFDAGVTHADGTAAADVAFEAVVTSPGGASRPVRVTRRGESFTGAVGDFAEPGDWTLVVKASRGGAEMTTRTARFTVFRQDLELANPRANPLLMRQLAEVTSGGVRSPEELPALFAEIASRPAAFETEEQWSYTPWDKWPMLLLLAGLMCGEWYLRKRWGLV